jgi:hypothetical protein
MAVLERDLANEERERRQSVRILAEEFARDFGWLHSTTPFSLEQLRRRSSKIRHGEDTIFGGCDLNFYRERRSRRPAAIAIHIVNPDVRKLEEIAATFGLRVEIVTNFPAWIDGAQLIVYTSAKPDKEKRRTKRKHTKQPTLNFDGSIWVS